MSSIRFYSISINFATEVSFSGIIHLHRQNINNQCHPYIESATAVSDIPYGRKFWRGIYFGRLVVLRAIRQYFICQTLQCAVIIFHNHSFHVYDRPAAGRASVIVGMELTIRSCIREYHVSKGFRTPEGGRRVGLLTQSKRCVRGRCKDQRWCRCQPLTEEDLQPVLCFRVGVVRSSETSLTAQLNSQRVRLAILL